MFVRKDNSMQSNTNVFKIKDIEYVFAMLCNTKKGLYVHSILVKYKRVEGKVKKKRVIVELARMHFVHNGHGHADD